MLTQLTKGPVVFHHYGDVLCLAWINKWPACMTLGRQKRVRKKEAIVQRYNHNMSGVNHGHQYLAYCSYTREPMIWTKKLVMPILDDGSFQFLY